MKVLIEAKEIPVGGIVTKKTGEKQYIIRDDIKIYGSTGPEQTETLRELRADRDTRFMVSEDCTINIISGNTELLWHVDAEELYRYLYHKTQLDHK